MPTLNEKFETLFAERPNGRPTTEYYVAKEWFLAGAKAELGIIKDIMAQGFIDEDVTIDFIERRIKERDNA